MDVISESAQTSEDHLDLKSIWLWLQGCVELDYNSKATCYCTNLLDRTKHCAFADQDIYGVCFHSLQPDGGQCTEKKQTR